MKLLLTLAYTGDVAFTLEEEADLFSAVSMLLFGQNFDMSVHQLPPRLKPKPPLLVKSDVEGEDSDDEDDENEDSRSVYGNCSSSSRASQVLPEESVNSSRKIWATFGEVSIATYCHGCNTQWKTLDRAQKCLLSHGLNRCWICFEVFTKTGKVKLTDSKARILDLLLSFSLSLTNFFLHIYSTQGALYD